jgi:hypothetical protein
MMGQLFLLNTKPTSVTVWTALSLPVEKVASLHQRALERLLRPPRFSA